MGRETSPSGTSSGGEDPVTTRDTPPTSDPPQHDGNPLGEAMDAMAAPMDSMLVHPAHILRCMRVWLTQQSSLSEDGRDDALSVEEASCGLWDLSANEDCASFMVGNQLLDLLAAVLGRAGTAPCRQVETACGLVANLLCHMSLRARLERHEDLLPAVVTAMLAVDDVAVLIASCSALTSAIKAMVPGSWKRTMVSRDCTARLLWIAENSLDAELLERALDLVGAVVCTSEAAMTGLLRAGLLQTVMGHLLAFCASLDADEPSSSPSARENVVDACLRVLEVVASHQDGVELLSTHEERLKECLLAILCGSDSDTLESSAAMVMAAWSSPGILRRFFADNVACLKVFGMLRAGEKDTQEAAWHLLEAACRTLGDAAALFPASALPEAIDTLSMLANDALPEERVEALKQFTALLTAAVENSSGRACSVELVAELQALRDRLD